MWIAAVECSLVRCSVKLVPTAFSIELKNLRKNERTSFHRRVVCTQIAAHTQHGPRTPTTPGCITLGGRCNAPARSRQQRFEQHLDQTTWVCLRGGGSVFVAPRSLLRRGEGASDALCGTAECRQLVCCCGARRQPAGQRATGSPSIALIQVLKYAIKLLTWFLRGLS